MSKAVNTNDPKYSKLTIGVCPDQWGVWFPEDPKQMDPRQAWEEMAEAGFEVIETGPFGYFPTDPKELQKWCDEFGMRVVAGTGWGILHKQEAWETTLKTFRAIAETHAAVGAEYIVHLPPLYRDDKTWEWTDDRVLSDDAWKLYVEHANALGQMLLDEYGLKMVLHPHGDSHIETPEEIARIFDATDPAYVNLCLDSGATRSSCAGSTPSASPTSTSRPSTRTSPARPTRRTGPSVRPSPRAPRSARPPACPRCTSSSTPWPPWTSRSTRSASRTATPASPPSPSRTPSTCARTWPSAAWDWPEASCRITQPTYH